MNIEYVKSRIKEFLTNRSQTFSENVGYCTTCFDTYYTEALPEQEWDYLLECIDIWSKEQFGDKNGQ